MKKINATFTKKQKLVRQQKQKETVWSEMETLVVVLSLKVRRGSNEDWISLLVSFIGVKNVKGVSRIWGNRMQIKVAEINAPLNLMKRKLSSTQFKNGKPYRCYHWLRQGALKLTGTYMNICRLIRLLITLPVELSSYRRHSHLQLAASRHSE